jgi:prepilin-type processing-associated H-X9-DG protein
LRHQQGRAQGPPLQIQTTQIGYRLETFFFDLRAANLLFFDGRAFFFFGTTTISLNQIMRLGRIRPFADKF